MQKPQKSEESLSISKQLPDVSSDDCLKVESTTKSSLGMLDFFKSASLKTQKLVVAIIAGLISSLIVAAIIQLFSNRILQPDSTTGTQLAAIGLAVFLTTIAVGAITFALESISINQINHDINALQTQCNRIASGDFSTEVIVSSPPELSLLAMSFNQMTQAINTRMIEAQNQLTEQEKVKEDLQQQLLQLLQGVEETFGSELTLHPEEAIDEEDEQTFTPPEGTLLEFLDRLLNVNSSKQANEFEVFFGSSRIEEIQNYKDDIQYREAWLQALLKETQKQLKFANFIMDRADMKKEMVLTELQKEMNS